MDRDCVGVTLGYPKGLQGLQAHPWQCYGSRWCQARQLVLSPTPETILGVCASECPDRGHPEGDLPVCPLSGPPPSTKALGRLDKASSIPCCP